MDLDGDDERRLWFRREVLPLEPLLRSYAARFRHGGWQEVDDLVHDTFTRLIECANWREIENLSGYAVQILKNLALQDARRRKIVAIQVMSDLEVLNLADERPGADRVVGARDELRLLARLVSELPPQCRRVFTLRKVYGLSNAEIAERLGLSISTVEKHLIKALRLCSERLADEPRRELQPRVRWVKARHRLVSE